MKKLILLFAVVTSVASAQVSLHHPTIKLVAIEKDTVNLGDSLWIDFICRPPGSYPYTYVNTQIQLSNPTYGTTPYLYNTPNFYSCDTFPIISFVTPDTTRRIVVYINPFYHTGASQILTANDNPADGKKDLYIRPVVSTAGINIYTIPKAVKEILYYDISGQEIQKPNELTNGFVIVRTLYSDGSFSVVKKYYN